MTFVILGSSIDGPIGISIEIMGRVLSNLGAVFKIYSCPTNHCHPTKDCLLGNVIGDWLLMSHLYKGLFIREAQLY